MNHDIVYPRDAIAGLVLAGGKSSRMGGGDKGLLSLRGRTLVETTLNILAPQCSPIAISTNNPADYASFCLALISDEKRDFSGPLAGILAGLEWLSRTSQDSQWLLSAPVDCPFLPADLGARLWHSILSTDKLLALAHSAGRTHYVCGLWHIDLRHKIRDLLVTKNIRRAQTIVEACGHSTAEWGVAPCDPFFNINTPDDLALADAQLQSRMI